MAGGPGAVPKVGLTLSRLIHKPFDIPMELTTSSYAVGKAGNDTVQALVGTVGQAYVGLQPRGPAKWLVPVFAKTLQATQHSQQIADRNTKVFWQPLSEGSEKVGMAISGPGAYYYAKKAGFPEPSDPKILSALIHSKGYPMPAPPQEGGGGGAEGAAQGAQGG